MIGRKRSLYFGTGWRPDITRYLEHIRRILGHDTSGFAAMALDCAVIETMEQFRRGEPKTPYGEGKKYFVSFLTETSFSPDVSKRKARIFYKNIRCGLLHQTEAEDSLIKRNSTRPLIAFTEDHKGVIVNAKVFHQRLEQVIREYAENLKDPMICLSVSPLLAKTFQSMAFIRN